VAAWTGSTHGIMGSGRSLASAGWEPGTTRSARISDDLGQLGSDGTHDERTIVRSVLDGDREAFRQLVEREGPGLVRACQRILGDVASAEDAAQEAFVIAYRSLATWRGDGPFGAWLARIGVRIALREASKRRPVAWRSIADGAAGEGADDAVTRATDRAAMAAVGQTDPALLSMRAERATEIRQAVIALPEPYREVVALRFFADATLDDIARQTGRPLGTVKTHLHRGLARLRASLEGSAR
jgi:RNA polymerase sigma-70 factor (ECF subfamily)